MDKNEKIVQFLKSHSDGRSAIQVAKALQLNTAASVNPTLHTLQRDGYVIKVDGTPPKWFYNHEKEVSETASQHNNEPATGHLAASGDRSKSEISITETGIKILSYVSSNKQPVLTRAIANALKLKTKHEINPHVYDLQKRGMLEKVDDCPPSWRLSRKGNQALMTSTCDKQQTAFSTASKPTSGLSQDEDMVLSQNDESRMTERSPQSASATGAEALINVAEANFSSYYYTNFEPISLLGQGGFGLVFKSKKMLEDHEYAVKRISLHNNEHSKKKVLREVRALAKLDHLGIVRYHNSWIEEPPFGWQEEKDKQFADMTSSTPGYTSEYSSLSTSNDISLTSQNQHKRIKQEKSKIFLYIQMQLCQQETLKEWLTANSSCRDYKKVLDIYRQVVSAVKFVHDRRMMHRDLKPSNVFFAMDGAVKVGDFGLVTALEDDEDRTGILGHTSSPHTRQIGTKLYISPEQILNEIYTYKIDIYALGVIFFECVYPFSTEMERVKTLTSVRDLEFPESFIKEKTLQHQFVQPLLSHNPNQRPEADTILTRLGELI